MVIPCCACGWMPASSYQTVCGTDADGQSYGGQSMAWFCVNKDCEHYQKAIEPVWRMIPSGMAVPR